MDKFTRQFVTGWRSLGLPFEGGTVIAAVSGGADSVSLLLALADLNKRKKITHRIVAAHFDHRLRGEESRADRRFVEDLCGQNGIACVTGEMRAVKKGNLEEQARRERYKFLSETAAANGAFAVLTGHTLNDQAETFLMNLVRGAGPEGLAAMRPVRPLSHGDDEISLVRPLLKWAKREDTEEFCRARGVDFRLDEMNFDPDFTRVRIRREVIPLLAQFNPKIIETLAQTAGLLAGTAAPRTREIADSLSVKALSAMPEPERLALIRAWIGAKRGGLRALGLKHVSAVDRLCASRKSGSVVEIPGGGRVVKQGGELRFANIKVDK